MTFGSRARRALFPLLGWTSARSRSDHAFCVRADAQVRAIERASGRHCVVKMAIFKSCLQDENLWELAKLASESLERLKGLLPPPLD